MSLDPTGFCVPSDLVCLCCDWRGWRQFLSLALRLATGAVYSLHKSSTRAHVAKARPRTRHQAVVVQREPAKLRIAAHVRLFLFFVRWPPR